MMSLFGLEIFDGTRQEFVQLLEQRLSDKPVSLPTVVFTPNPEQIVLAKRDSDFFMLLRRATYLIPDGIGLVYASRLLHKPLKERIAGTDVVTDLLQLANRKKMLVIGGRDYAQHKDIFWTEGFANVQQSTPKEEEALTKTFQKVQPEIVFVAFGAPEQEKFIAKYFDLFLNNKVMVVMAVGGAFDILWGKVPRAPRFVQAAGFEWLFRLVREPWRWKRQLRLVQFIWLTMGEAATSFLRST